MVAILSLSTYTLEKHFCGDSLEDIAVFGETEQCCITTESNESNKLHFSKSNCCNTEINFITVNVFDSLKTNKLTKKEVKFVACFFCNYLDNFTSYSTDYKLFNDFSPPEIWFDKQIKFQTFLI